MYYSEIQQVNFQVFLERVSPINYLIIVVLISEMPINDSTENILVDEKDVIEDADKPPPNLASVCPPGITKL